MKLFFASYFFLAMMSTNSYAWKMDDRTRFNLAYLPEVTPTTMGDARPALKTIQTYAPDIDNIQYSKIREMGFPFPEKVGSEKLKLYLKLYHSPEEVDVYKTASTIFDSFSLSKIKNGKKFYSYVKNPNNVLIKYALIDRSDRVFSKQSPILSPLFKGLGQSDFDSHLPYSSLYVVPDKLPLNADESTQAVQELYKEIRAYYVKTMELHETTTDGTEIFQSGKQRLELRQPMIFKNYKDLPMPQGKSIFLSGLLLIKYIDLNSKYSHMLEIASVYDDRKL